VKQTPKPGQRIHRQRQASDNAGRQDSLAYALFQSAKLIQSVREGESLTNRFENLLATNGNWSDSVRGSVRDLTWSTLRGYGRGDVVLSHMLQSPLPPRIHALLLVALQRLEQKPAQAHTIVDQAVRATAMAAPGLKGVVNGVLRNVLRRGAEVEQWRESNIASRHCYPDWWVRRVKREHEANWQSILAAGNTHPPMSLRVNRRRMGVADYHAALIKTGIDATRLSKTTPCCWISHCR